MRTAQGAGITALAWLIGGALALAGSGAGAVEPVRREYYVIPACAEDVVGELRATGATLHVLREDLSAVADAAKSEHDQDGRPGTTRDLKSGSFVMNVTEAKSQGVFELLELHSRAEEAKGPNAATCDSRVFRVSVDFPLLVTEVPAPRSADEPLETITFELVYGSKRVNLNGDLAVPVAWLPDGEHYLQPREKQLYRVHAETGRAEPYFDPEALAKRLADLPGLDDKAAQRIAQGSRFEMNADCTGFMFLHAGDVYYAAFDGSRAAALTQTEAQEELPRFSPDGTQVAFVRDDDLYVVDMQTQSERRLTSGGTALVRNGKADWVYYEELFHRNWLAYRWSPDSKRIAFMQFDDTGVDAFVVLDSRRFRQRVEQERFPQAGTQNPVVRLGVVTVDGAVNGESVPPPAWVDLQRWDAADLLISGFGWTPDSASVYFFAQNRTQQWLDFAQASAAGGTPRVLFREASRYWVAEPAAPTFLEDGGFVWLSERDGFKHLYRIGPDGASPQRLTAGEWEVRSVQAVDEQAGWVYLTGTRDSSLALHGYRVRLDGSGLERLTAEAGTHALRVSPNHRWFIDEFSSHGHPPRVALKHSDGQPVRVIDTNPVPARERLRFGSFEFVQMTTDDGCVLEGTLVKPPDFDASQSYPAWFLTYGGPHAPQVRDLWQSGRLFDHLLANMGFVVFRCDPRSASGKGLVSAGQAHRRLGVQELKDIEQAIAWLIDQGYVDRERIGMSGHSYGGYLTAYAMTHSKLFARGIAGAPVTDWRHYDTIYTERYMGLPSENAEGYRQSSVVEGAKDLHGRLLLLHGEMDDNVHLHNTLDLAEALQKAERDFEMMIYPGQRHSLSGRHYQRTVIDFIAVLKEGG